MNENIVTTDQMYNYDILQQDINELKAVYPFLEIGTIGKSVLRKNITYIKIGNGEKQVFYSGSYHANEWIVTPVLMKFVEEYANAYTKRSEIYGYSAEELYNTTSIYIVPMVNPDGVDLVTGNIDKNSEIYRNTLQIARNYPSIPFPDGWKANIRGVDLNLQFPAGWDNAQKIKFGQGFRTPAPRDYVGLEPLTEPESRAIYNFTRSHNFELILAYHTQGKEIYWEFLDYAPPQSLAIGQEFARTSGYELAKVPYISSFAGYKDWFMQEYRRPGFTIEAGFGENPLKISQFDEIYSDNLGILLLGAIL